VSAMLVNALRRDDYEFLGQAVVYLAVEGRLQLDQTEQLQAIQSPCFGLGYLIEWAEMIAER